MCFSAINLKLSVDAFWFIWLFTKSCIISMNALSPSFADHVNDRSMCRMYPPFRYTTAWYPAGFLTLASRSPIHTGPASFGRLSKLFFSVSILCAWSQ